MNAISSKLVERVEAKSFHFSSQRANDFTI